MATLNTPALYINGTLVPDVVAATLWPAPPPARGDVLWDGRARGEVELRDGRRLEYRVGRPTLATDRTWHRWDEAELIVPVVYTILLDPRTGEPSGWGGGW